MALVNALNTISKQIEQIPDGWLRVFPKAYVYPVPEAAEPAAAAPKPDRASASTNKKEAAKHGTQALEGA